MSVEPPIYMCEGGGREEGRREGEGEVWSYKLINTKDVCSHSHTPHTSSHLHTVSTYHPVVPTYVVTHGTPSPHTPLPSLHTHTLSILTLSHPHTPTNLISLIQLCKLLHFVLLQSSWHLFDVMCEDVDDLVEHCEHGLWDDLEHL